MVVLLGLLICGEESGAAADCRPLVGDPRFSARESYRCRNRPPSIPTLRLGVDLGLGTHTADAELDHLAFAFGIPLDVRITEAFWLGGRAEYLTGGDRGLDTDNDGRDDMDTTNLSGWGFSFGPRLVLFTEPARQEAWRFGFNGGYFFSDNNVVSDGPIIELALERQFGALFASRGSTGRFFGGVGQEFSVGLRMRQGLSAIDDYRSALIVLAYATEIGARLPDGPGPEPGRPDIEHTVTLEDQFVIAGAGDGAGIGTSLALSLGLPLGRLLQPIVRGDLLLLQLNNENDHERDGVTQLTVLTGLHVGRWSLLFAEALMGYAVAFGTDPSPVGSGYVVDLATGFQFPNMLGCGFGIWTAPRVRFGLSRDNGDFVAVGVAAGVQYDSLVRAAECHP